MKTKLFGLLLWVEYILRKRAKPTAAPQQILVLEYLLPLGCCIHLTPLYEALRRCNPDAQIILATRGIGLQVNRHSPWIDVLLETPDPLKDLPATAKSLRAQLKRLHLRPDCILTGGSDQRTRVALLALLSGPGWRGGYTLNPVLYQKPLLYDRSQSLIQNSLRLVELFGCQSPLLEPHVAFCEQDMEYARKLIAAANPQSRPVAVLVTQNSGGQRTGWHTDRWVSIIQKLTDCGYALLYVGTAAEAKAVQELIEISGQPGTSIAGQTTISQLAAVMASADLAVSLDTGPMHVARAAGVPLIVLGPSWQRPIEWLPLRVANARILRGPDRDDVPPGYCLDEISVDMVIAAIDDLTAKFPPSAHDRQHRSQHGLSNRDLLA